MTVIVGLRTSTAAVLAADSILTTQGIAGLNPDGTPRWLPQSYEHAVKITGDSSETAIAAFAGHGAIGAQNATEYFSRVRADLDLSPADQDARVRALVDGMVTTRRQFATEGGFPPDQSPATTLLLAAAPTGGVAPRMWRIGLEGDTMQVQEILQNPGVWFEGSVHSIMTLLYGS